MSPVVLAQKSGISDEAAIQSMHAHLIRIEQAAHQRKKWQHEHGAEMTILSIAVLKWKKTHVSGIFCYALRCGAVSLSISRTEVEHWKSCKGMGGIHLILRAASPNQLDHSEQNPQKSKTRGHRRLLMKATDWTKELNEIQFSISSAVCNIYQCHFLPYTQFELMFVYRLYCYTKRHAQHTYDSHEARRRSHDILLRLSAVMWSGKKLITDILQLNTFELNVNSQDKNTIA